MARLREPIQVYLTDRERARLDRVAGELGVSRSEALRRGIEALGNPPNTGPLPDLSAEGIVTPALGGRDAPPRGTPVAPLAELLTELRRDRDGR